MPIIMGTLKVTLIAMIFSIPISLAAAVYTAEFASKWARETIKPIVEMLAGFPSVVLGFFALIVLASWLQDLFDFEFRLNAVAAGLALSLAVVPIIFTVCEDALSAVPRNSGSFLGSGGNPGRDQYARCLACCHARHLRRHRVGIRPRCRRNHDRVDGLGERGNYLVVFCGFNTHSSRYYRSRTG
jgi:ABC-type uncharacterized transport system permease subunit